MSNKIEGGLVFHDCFGCGKEFREDDVSWAMPDGRLTVMKGDPYCDACLPETQGCDHCGNVSYGCACDGGAGRQTPVEVIK
jgi:hypothetical protein